MTKRRTITVELSSNASDEEYARLANTIWLVASTSPAFRAVQPDGITDPNYLNRWWDEDSRVRWPE